MTAHDAADRLAGMLAALSQIDSRFSRLLTGGDGPDPSIGWRLVDTTALALVELMAPSGPPHPAATKWTPDWSVGFWNGLPEAGGRSVGIGTVVEGVPSHSPIDLRSYATVSAGTDGLTDAQREAIVAAVIDAWDPDECTVRERQDGTTRVRLYNRGEGWRPG